MKSRQSPSPAPGPDLLARYLNAYVQARQLSDIERPWGLGDDSLESLWVRLSGVIAGDPQRVNRIISEELSESDRAAIAEALAPLIFAFPLRAFPAELRAIRSGPLLVLSIRDLELNTTEQAGHLPSGLIPAFAGYLRRVLRWPHDRLRHMLTISSGGRRRRVRVTILSRGRGLVIRFLERLPSPADEHVEG